MLFFPQTRPGLPGDRLKNGPTQNERFADIYYSYNKRMKKSGGWATAAVGRPVVDRNSSHRRRTTNVRRSLVARTYRLELCAAAVAPPPPTECRRRAGAVFVTCSRHVVLQLYVAGFLYCRLRRSLNIEKKQ